MILRLFWTPRVSFTNAQWLRFWQGNERSMKVPRRTERVIAIRNGFPNQRAAGICNLLSIFSLSSVFFFPSAIFPSAIAQQPILTFHSSSHLVLVDVMALKNGLPDQTLQRDDFQLFDNGQPIAIKTFDTGRESTTRPLTLWMVVQCTMPGLERQGSGLFAGQINRFAPALKSLDKRDTVGVAHWCDNGDSQIDLQPTNQVESAAPAVEQVLGAAVSPKDHDRSGELALQKTLQLIVDTTRAARPEPLPVVIFLYGDWSGMPRHEADHFIDELLQTSAVAFGLRDRRSPHIWWVPGEQREVAHYITTETGGEYLEVTPETYADGMEQILRQLHFRYELGFQPAALDGKRHKLTVKLTSAAQTRHRNLRLRFREAYVPVREAGN